MRTAINLLTMLTTAYPPFDGAKHAILLYEGKLHVVLALKGKQDEFQHITLDESDLDRSASELFADIAAVLAQNELTAPAS